MKVLVLGGGGQLGQALVTTAPDAVNCRSVDHSELEITDASRLLTTCHTYNPDVIVNAAAYTAVDGAESNADLAQAVNDQGSRNVAMAAKSIGARLLHVSTDFVFDGSASIPYKPSAPTHPLGVYGRSKRDGELAVLDILPDNAVVVRTAWIYGATGNNFVKTMLQLMSERNEVSVVDDQIGTPTWANSVASTLWKFADSQDVHGIYHWTDAGQASWYEFAENIREEGLSSGLLQKPVPINAISTAEFPTAAERPRYSVLDCSGTCAALDIQQTHWQDNLHQMIKGMRA